MTKQKKLECLLPDALKEYLNDESSYPYLRLILTEHNSSRPHMGLKEARIAETWPKAMGCDKGTEAYKQLAGFKNLRSSRTQVQLATYPVWSKT
jgi:hypothetical protein